MAGAVVALNALGDVYDWRTEHKIAGALSDDGKSFIRTDDVVYGGFAVYSAESAYGYPSAKSIA